MADGDEGPQVAGSLSSRLCGGRPAARGGRPQRGPGMLDRHRERAAIDRVLDSVREGFSDTLVLLGGHGTGKTMLLEYAIDSAPDLRVSSVIGVESEISLEFAALHQLLVPFMALLPTLPAPQRDAMKIAFGLEAASPPDPFLPKRHPPARGPGTVPGPEPSAIGCCLPKSERPAIRRLSGPEPKPERSSVRCVPGRARLSERRRLPCRRRSGELAGRPAGGPAPRLRLSRRPRPGRPVDGRAPGVPRLRPGRPVRPFPAELLGVTWLPGLIGTLVQEQGPSPTR